MPQLLASERMAPEQLRKLQYAQLHALLTHAFERSEFWRQRLTGIGWSPREGTGPQVLQRLPVLARSDLQEHFEALHARPLPAAFGKTGMTESSGATGKSVRVMKCAVQSYLYDAITLRDHLWHKRDFSRKIGVLKPNGNRPPRADWDGLWPLCTDPALRHSSTTWAQASRSSLIGWCESNPTILLRERTVSSCWRSLLKSVIRRCDRCRE